VQPAWSPNNKRIAYWGTETGQRDMFTIPVAGGDAVAVTNDAAIDWGPKWSSDGRYLYFASDRGGAMNIWRVAIDESTGQPRGEPEPITQGVTSSEQVSLSRDGARLAFRSSSVSSNPAAIPFDEAGERLGAPKALFDRSGNLSPSSASPDGKWLAYWNIGELQEDVFISHPDGTGLRRLTDDMFRDRFGAWSPDSTELAFYSNRSGVYNIHAVRPDGSGLRAITERPGGNDANLLYPVFSPTGDRLVASRIRADDSILLDPRKPWSSQTPEKLPMAIADLGWMVPNQWSPDAARLLGPILNTSGAPIATGVYDFASRKARLVEKAQVIFQGYAWLSDSRRVIYILGNDLVLVDVDSGRRKVLPTGVQLGFGLALGHDRRTVYVSIVREQADIWIGETKK
jgi:TolB protein